MNPDYLRSLRRHYGRIGLALFAYLAVTLAAELLFEGAAAFLFPSFTRSGWYLPLLSAVPMYLIGFPIFLWVLPPKPEKELLPPKQKLPLKNLWPLFLMCFGFLYPGNLIGQGIDAVLSAVFRAGSGNPLEQLAGDSDLLAYGLLAVVIGPIMEEITFRKLLLDRMRTIDKPAAVFFSALAFGLFHGNVVQFFYAFGVGLLFGVIYVRTGRLRYTIVLHMVVNFFGSVVTMLILPHVDLLNPLNAILPLLCLSFYALLLMAAAVAGVVLLIKRRKSLYVGDGADRLAGRRFSTAFCTWGGALYLLASLGVFAMKYI